MTVRNTSSLLWGPNIYLCGESYPISNHSSPKYRLLKGRAGRQPAKVYTLCVHSLTGTLTIYIKGKVLKSYYFLKFNGIDLFVEFQSLGSVYRLTFNPHHKSIRDQ